MKDDTTTFGATDVAWLKATRPERDRVLHHINRHARDEDEAAEFFEMITGHKTGSETDQ